MTKTLSHRGPDNTDIFIDSNHKLGFGHTRLAILGLEKTGNQPMSYRNRTLWITYNGEIYNFKEIKKNLLAKGHEFKSHTDTEVILAAYSEYGEKCLHMFNGMFAFAIYDSAKNILFLARDRFGIKPLYYIWTGQIFAFASEIKALLSLPEVSLHLNRTAVAEYFIYRYIPAPNTIWQEVQKVPHGQHIHFDMSTCTLTTGSWYSLTEQILNRAEATVEEVYDLIYSSIEHCMVSDVPVGSFLSGGIDSTLVTSIANRISPGIQSFTIGFNPPEKSELRFAQQVANYLGTRHHYSIIEDVSDALIKEITDTFDEPLADSSVLPTYLLSAMTSKHVKVVLSGDGGDEVFSGYRWYEKFIGLYGQQQINDSNEFIGTFAGLKTHEFISNYDKLLLDRFNVNNISDLFTGELSEWKNEFRSVYEKYFDTPCRTVKALRWLDLNTFLVDDILTKVDRASMAHSLEVRIPFLDYRLVEAVFRLPESILPSHETGKVFLKNFSSKYIPDFIIHRKKQGFSAPFQDWNFFKHDVLNPASYKDCGLMGLNHSYCIKLFNRQEQNWQAKLWMIFNFMKWGSRWYKK